MHPRHRRTSALGGAALLFLCLYESLALESPLGIVRLFAALGAVLLVTRAMSAPEPGKPWQPRNQGMWVASAAALLCLFPSAFSTDGPRLAATLRERTPIGASRTAVHAFYFFHGMQWRSREGESNATFVTSPFAGELSKRYEVLYTFDAHDEVTDLKVVAR